jgi:hypothetical protein
MGYGLEEDNSDYFVSLLNESERNDRVRDMSVRYAENKGSRIDTTIECACCKRRIIKANYQSQFCSNKGKGNCKDQYWNAVREARSGSY